MMFSNAFKSEWFKGLKIILFSRVFFLSFCFCTIYTKDKLSSNCKVKEELSGEKEGNIEADYSTVCKAA